jgi:hypothetical protein
MPNTEPAEELSPAESLALITRQQQRVNDDMAGAEPANLIVWGLAWAIGFLALWLTEAFSPAFAIPPDAAWPVFAAALFVAGVVSAGIGIWSGRGIKAGAEVSFSAKVYGFSWPLGLVAVTALGVGLIQAGMPEEVAALFFPSAYCLVVAMLYLAGAALWRATSMLVAGPWLLLVAAVAPFLGLPHNYLLMAVGGGGAFLAVGIAGWIVRRRQRRGVDRG